MLPAHYKSTLIIFNQITLDETVPKLHHNLEIQRYKEAEQNLTELQESAIAIQLQPFANYCKRFKEFIAFRQNEFDPLLENEFQTFLTQIIILKEFIMESTSVPISFDVINAIKNNLNLRNGVPQNEQKQKYPLPNGYKKQQPLEQSCSLIESNQNPSQIITSQQVEELILQKRNDTCCQIF